MEQPSTLVGLVSALVQTYASGLNHYERWKRRRAQLNHYRKQGTRGQNGIVTCALSTSLGASGPQIKDTYDIAIAIVGSEFATGGASCREILRAQLNELNSRVTHLQQVASSMPGLLDLADVFQTSESVRIACLQALTEQYQQIAAGRPIPKELPVPKPRSRQEGQYRSIPNTIPDYEDDRMTTAMTVSSGALRFQSEPPSPPPTPKLTADDESTWAPSEAASGAHTTLLRPKNSVFSIFCPVAMALQVDIKKPVPESRKCKCGYRWKSARPDKKDALLKEGFRMTDRFLAKSHCDQDGFGCVLCTSSGRTETYESAEHLRSHINASHTKWQMLHDRDMT